GFRRDCNILNAFGGFGPEIPAQAFHSASMARMR
ncbi:MAG: hypothetical protein JWR14_1791, partial [Caballeronia sp.]|nr:hypothetical protein [Caballeronia sp.]